MSEYEKLVNLHQPNYIKKLKGNDQGRGQHLVISPAGSNKTKSTNRQKPKKRNK